MIERWFFISCFFVVLINFADSRSIGFRIKNEGVTIKNFAMFNVVE